MSLSEELLRTRQAKRLEAIQRSVPKGWRAGWVNRPDGTTEVTTDPYEFDVEAVDPTHLMLLEGHGYDPKVYKIVGEIRNTAWTAYIPSSHRKDLTDEMLDQLTKDEIVEDFTTTFRTYRFTVVERPEGELSIDELVDVVNKAPVGSSWGNAAASQPRHGGLIPELPYWTAIGDTQIGKELDSPTELVVSRTMDLIDRAAEPLLSYREETGELFHWAHLPWLGDCIEGMNSQGGRLRWRTRLTITEQVRVIRRLMLYQAEVFAPLAKKVTMLSIPGNHDEASTRDMDTRYDDSWAIEAMNQVSDALAYAPDRFGHVECYVPGVDEWGITMEIGDTVAHHSHGHEHAHGKHFPYWAGQALGDQPMGRAQFWIQGHGHHWWFEEEGKRRWMEVPAMEQQSLWWIRKKGTGGNPGIVTLQTDGGNILNATKLEPRVS